MTNTTFFIFEIPLGIIALVLVLIAFFHAVNSFVSFFKDQTIQDENLHRAQVHIQKSIEYGFYAFLVGVAYETLYVFRVYSEGNIEISMILLSLITGLLMVLPVFFIWRVIVEYRGPTIGVAFAVFKHKNLTKRGRIYSWCLLPAIILHLCGQWLRDVHGVKPFELSDASVLVQKFVYI